MANKKRSLLGGKPHKFEATGDFAERLEGDDRRQRIPPEAVVERMGLTGNERVVDLGSGLGYFAIPISKVAGEVVAVDIEPKMLVLLSQKALSVGSTNVHLLLGDISSVPLSDSAVDHVFAAFVYHEVPVQSKLIEECARILRPSGKLTIVDFQKRFSGEGPPIWVKKSPAHVIRTASPWFIQQNRYDTDVFYQLSFVKK